MKNKKKKIVFVACDTSNLKQIKKIINQIKSSELDIIPKFGMQFFYSKDGRKFLEGSSAYNLHSMACPDLFILFCSIKSRFKFKAN